MNYEEQIAQAADGERREQSEMLGHQAAIE